MELLYEEALYTVLYRAGTMGPDQVDDQEVLLSYLQQVRRSPHPLMSLSPETDRFAPCHQHMHTGVKTHMQADSRPGKME